MVARYVAIKDDEALAVMLALDKVGITYEYFGHDDVWSVIKMLKFNSVNGLQSTYNMALNAVGVK